MKSIVSLALLVIAGASTSGQQGPPPPATKPPAAAATRTLADDVVAGIKRHTPEWGTYLGLPDAEHGRVTDNSLQARTVWRDEEDAWRKRLAAIDRKALEGRPESVIYGFLDHLLQTTFENRVCEEELWSINQIVGWQTYFGQLARMQPIDSVALQGLALYVFVRSRPSSIARSPTFAKASARGMRRHAETSNR